MKARTYNGKRLFRHILVTFVIYPPIMGFVFLHILLEIYHQIGFRLCGIPRVPMKNYIKIDRQKLSYLKYIEKINCMYCGYTNGLIMYVQEIAARTEQYWCGIQHEKNPHFIAPKHHKNFSPFNDEAAFEKKYPKKGKEVL